MTPRKRTQNTVGILSVRIAMYSVMGACDNLTLGRCVQRAKETATVSDRNYRTSTQVSLFRKKSYPESNFILLEYL